MVLIRLPWVLVSWLVPSIFGFVAPKSALPMRTVPMAFPPGGPPTPPGGGVAMDPGLKLALCVLIDFVGIASFAAPGVGEVADAGWAPVSALLVNYLFGNGVFTTLALVEELLPGFDIIPTATIAWVFEQYSNNDGPPEDFDKRTTNTSTPPPRESMREDAIDVTTV